MSRTELVIVVGAPHPKEFAGTAAAVPWPMSTAPAVEPPKPVVTVPGVTILPLASIVAAADGVWIVVVPPPVTRAVEVKEPPPTTVTVPEPPGVAHVPSPRQNVEEEAEVPLLRLVTGRLPVTPEARLTWAHVRSPLAAIVVA